MQRIGFWGVELREVKLWEGEGWEFGVEMAVAAELTSWSGRELGSPVRKKRAWGADAQQLMQLMMGQLRSQPAAAAAPELTLDLLGNADPSSSCVTTQLSGSSDLDLHVLRPEESLPSGWEKCLDLQVQ